MHRFSACVGAVSLAAACTAPSMVRTQSAGEWRSAVPSAPDLQAEIRVVELSSSALDELLPELREREFLASLGAERTADLMESAERNGTLLTESRVPLWYGGTGSVSVRSKRAYVADFEVSKATGVEAADPVIGVLDAGFDLALHASRASENGGALALEVKLSWTRIIAVSELATSAGRNIEPVTVELPEWRASTAELAASIRPGEWVAVGRRIDDAPALVALIRVD